MTSPWADALVCKKLLKHAKVSPRIRCADRGLSEFHSVALPSDTSVLDEEVVLGTLVEPAADASSRRNVQAQASMTVSLPRVIQVMQDFAEQIGVFDSQLEPPDT